MGFKVLIVEDEVSINDILVSALRADGYTAKGVFLGKDAQDALEIFHPDLILLDINLPDENGFELCRYINNKYCIPIIMLTARNDIVDKVLGLELGADDYITKPFNIKEVLTRVKVAIRRVNKYKEKSEEEFIYINKFVKVNLEGRIVFKDEEEVKLKPQEYELLEFFIKNRNIVFSREILLNKVWGFDYEGEVRTVDVHVRRLRSKLDKENATSIIDTVFGIGYVMR
ncbi:response regulator transcription factor [Clostridium botulinum]|uniref:winged helix-turn-helix domain-containing protein n=1 Tax=Clostridium sporogenes TaxID=1509 RepID=UPI0013CF5579|nr:response regulator transcription factor [Clostridium botulinum]EKO1913205.1 response regulator transcription factor [Clostridium botulinum]EKO2043267.1 response regulator transcription factor [Clostridium botulinum]NFE81042.1 response regulator transcription factor [Clostridium sporogenes]NFG69356.1 response regulator transcription factor [Clostridium sporogenes]